MQKDYITKEPIKLDGKDIKVGSKITLDDDVATDLKAVGHIEEAPGVAVPIDPAEREAAIAEAIKQIDPANNDLWLKDGRPDVGAIGAITGWGVTAAERNAVWEKIKPAA